MSVLAVIQAVNSTAQSVIFESGPPPCANTMDSPNQSDVGASNVATQEDSTASKQCHKCAETKPASAFSRLTDSHDGLGRWCKACAKENNAAWRAEHPNPYPVYRAKRAVGSANAIDDAFGYWLAGFADGEGSFNITGHNGSYACSFHIGLRIDDLPVLESIRDALGFGKIFFEKARPDQRCPNASCRFLVQSIHEASLLADVFRKYPLRSKKRRDCEVWGDAVAFLAANQLRGTKWGADPRRAARDSTLMEFKRRLEAVRVMAAA